MKSENALFKCTSLISECKSPTYNDVGTINEGEGDGDGDGEAIVSVVFANFSGERESMR